MKSAAPDLVSACCSPYNTAKIQCSFQLSELPAECRTLSGLLAGLCLGGADALAFLHVLEITHILVGCRPSVASAATTVGRGGPLPTVVATMTRGGDDSLLPDRCWESHRAALFVCCRQSVKPRKCQLQTRRVMRPSAPGITAPFQSKIRQLQTCCLTYLRL